MRSIVVLTILLLAGCAGPTPDENEPPLATPAGLDLAIMPNRGDAVGLSEVGTLMTEYRQGLGTRPYNLAMGGDVLLASIGGPTGALGGPMAMGVWTIEDPFDPIRHSQLPIPAGGVEAVTISPDGKWGFLGGEFDGAVGIWAFDLSNPGLPIATAYTPMPTEGPHNIRYAEIHGQPYIIASIAHVATPAGLVGLGQDPIPVFDLRVDILRFDPASPRQPMLTVSSYQALDPAGVPGTRLVHDAVVQKHPITGQHLMYVAYWDAGVRVVDVDDALRPREIGVYADPSPSDFLIIHTVQPHPTLIGGRHITVATSQCAYAPASECHLRILDTTDPTKIRQIATWQLPAATHGAGLTSEIFTLQDETIIAPWGGAGTWVLNISKPDDPHAVAFERASGFANAALVRDEAIYVADAQGPVRILRQAPIA